MTWRQSPVGRRNSVRVVLASLLLAVGSAWALPVTPTLPLQGVLRTAAGGPVTDGTYVITVRLYDTETGGAALWQETMPAVAVVGGLFLTSLGQTVPLPTALTQGNAPVWLGVQVGVEPELPRTSLGYVPRALWADVAGTAQALACDGCVQGAALANGAVTADKVAFPYAGAATAGGAATAADSAKSALTADVAKDLQCTGCVAWSELGTDVGSTLVSTFLSQSGGTVTGSLKVTETLTVGQVLDLSSAVVTGARLGVNGASCDPAHAGGLTYANGRISVCDGVAWKKLTFCGEQCVDPAKVTCGQAIPDQCGDTGVCAGKGTLCANAGEQCVSDVCVAVPTSCLAIHVANGSKPTGVYQIDPDGAGGVAPFNAYCDMTNDGGGWTMVLKMNGALSTFGYDTAYWTTNNTYQADKPEFDQVNEHKNAAFGTLPFTAMRVTLFANTYKTLAFPMGGSSLLALFGSDTYQPTYFGRDTWFGMMPNSSQLPNCSREGINVRATATQGSTPTAFYTVAYDPGVLRTRLGILTNNEGNCINPDAVIGLGVAGKACGQNSTGTAGNFAFCGAFTLGGSQVDQSVAAWAYVFVR